MKGQIMSKCVSSHGEFSAHIPVSYCERCGASVDAGQDLSALQVKVDTVIEQQAQFLSLLEEFKAMAGPMVESMQSNPMLKMLGIGR